MSPWREVVFSCKIRSWARIAVHYDEDTRIICVSLAFCGTGKKNHFRDCKCNIAMCPEDRLSLLRHQGKRILVKIVFTVFYR